jgi:flagellar L-ring protein precursor FlgH
MSTKSRANLAVAWSAALSIPVVAAAQTLPPTQNHSAYTTSPEAAGVTSAAAAPPAVPIGILMERSGGSLLRAESYNQADGAPVTTHSSSYYDVPEPKPKLLRKHDLVTILIRENSQFISNGTTDLNRTSDLDAVINSYVALGWHGGGLSLDGRVPETPIEFKGNGTRDFKGQADVNRADTFTGRITAEVLDVKPNGNLVVEATENIKTDDELQRVTLTGTCRVDDITADNTVMSNQLFDLSLDKQHKGAVKDTMKRGLIGRLLDFINPF